MTVNVRNLSKTYALGERVVHALRNVDLAITEPGFHAVMGASGSGKSTLLHLLAGLDRADSGEIEVAGRRVDQLTERQLTIFRRHTVGIIFQQFNLIPTLSAVDNIMLPGLLDRRSRNEMRDKAEQLLEELDLADRADHRPDALSGGEQQRAAICRALLFDPPVLLADEPTGNLDSVSSEALWGLLKQFAAQREMTVIVVTHEPAAAAVCERVTVLRDGEVVDAFDVESQTPANLATRAAKMGGESTPGKMTPEKIAPEKMTYGN